MLQGALLVGDSRMRGLRGKRLRPGLDSHEEGRVRQVLPRRRGKRESVLLERRRAASVHDQRL